MSRRTEAGFTLLEIVVALAIAAVGIAAVAKYTASAAEVSFQTEERMVAVWAAGNRLSELRITRAWPAPGTYDSETEMGGRTWYLTDTVSGTGQPDIRRVDVAVYTEPQRGVREFSIQGYVARYTEPEEGLPENPGAEGGPQEDDDAGDSDNTQDPGGEAPEPADEDPGQEVQLPGDAVGEDNNDRGG